MFNTRDEGAVWWPSPLLVERPPHTLLHFQFAPDGQLTSPQIAAQPPGEAPKLPIFSQQTRAQMQAQLDRVQALVDRQELLSLLPENAASPHAMLVSPLVQTPAQRLLQQR